MKDGHHSSLVGGPCILQPEWHDRVVKISQRCVKGSLLPIRRVHTDMSVADIPLYETIHLMTHGSIY